LGFCFVDGSGLSYFALVPRTIYLDYNATTPLDPAVGEAMQPFLHENWGNPSSVHHLGRKARAALDEARERAAHFLGAKPSELIFTSGGTEANNLAILGTARALKGKGKHLITSAIEHHAVLHCFDYLEKNEGFLVTRLPVNPEGRVAVEDLVKALQADTIIVSVMAANNEIGTLQPVAEIGSLCRSRGVIFHTDAVQWFGKEPFTDLNQFNADLVSLCGHKFHGPKGAGLLFIRSPLHPDPILFGGAQENERRSGTENLPAIVGLVESITRFLKIPVFDKSRLRPLKDQLENLIHSIPGCEMVSSKVHGLSNTVAFVVTGTDGMALMAGLDLEGICASSGSACSAGSLEPSHVITALGKRDTANALVRFSLGRETSGDEINQVIKILPEVIRRAQLNGKTASGW